MGGAIGRGHWRGGLYGNDIMKLNIDKTIFELFPGMKIVTAVANGLGTANVNAIADELDTAWQNAAREAVKYENPQSHPNIAPWGERMKAAGAPRKKFPSSIEALTRRAGKGGEPVRIGPLVDFYNAISLRYLVPAGGFDIDDLRYGLELRLSRDGDTFKGLDDDEVINLPAGEVSYADGKDIVTRHFVWKQSRRAMITPESKNIFFISEVLGELPFDLVEDVHRAFVEGIKRHFNVEARMNILDSQNLEIDL